MFRFYKKNNYIDKIIFGIHSIKHLKKITNSNIKKINYPTNLISKKQTLLILENGIKKICVLIEINKNALYITTNFFSMAGLF